MGNAIKSNAVQGDDCQSWWNRLRCWDRKNRFGCCNELIGCMLKEIRDYDISFSHSRNN